MFSGFQEFRLPSDFGSAHKRGLGWVYDNEPRRAALPSIQESPLIAALLQGRRSNASRLLGQGPIQLADSFGSQ